MSTSSPEPATDDRRSFLDRASSWAMLGGLAGSYGMLAIIAGRFLYPSQPLRRQWLFVAEADLLAVGSTVVYLAPRGETVNITRHRAAGAVDDFVALSSTCPHLGCQVHWEAQNQRYFCPCHNGTFAPDGRGTGGPPGEAGLSLPRYALKLEGGLLYVEMTVDPLGLASAGQVVERAPGIHAAGHDPCLAGRGCARPCLDRTT